MRSGKPGISSYDMFAMGHAIRQELKSMGGNLLNLNSSIMKLSDGDDESRASLDPVIGTREVRKVSGRQIGHTVSSTRGGLGPTSTPARTANLLGNPYMRRYEGPDANGSYNFGLPGSPSVGEYYDVYESENNRLRFLDDTIGRELLGYTHLENAAIERSGDASTDEVYLRSTYSVFGDINYPFDNQDIEASRLGSKRYSPSEPYVLKPLESGIVRRTMNGSVQGFKEKFEAFIPGREPYKGSLLDMWDHMGSHYYLNLLNGIAEHGLYVENYEFEPRERVSVYDTDDMPQSDYAYFLNVDTHSPEKDIKGLLGKTNRLFYEGKIRSLANRFATLTAHDEGTPDFLNTATDHLYGLSRGRNLRKLDLTNENGYPNPYCRVWTTHYQYSKIKNLIRGKWMDNAGNEHYTLHGGDQIMRPNKGYDRLKAMTSIDTENGKPIYAPYYVNDRSVLEKDSIKRCMFSIENLAWKDIIPDVTLIRKNGDERITSFSMENESSNGTESLIFKDGFGTYSSGSSSYSWQTQRAGTANGFGLTLTKEQRGPNGGRIMWFPPYNLHFNEVLNANWNPNEFIGRGERIFSYINSERKGSLSFTILVDHPSIINEWARGGKLGKTANKVDPLSKDENILRFFAGCGALEFNPRKEYTVPYGITATTKITEEYESRSETHYSREPVKKTSSSWTTSDSSKMLGTEQNPDDGVGPEDNPSNTENTKPLGLGNNTPVAPGNGNNPGDIQEGQDRQLPPNEEEMSSEGDMTFYSIFYFPNDYSAGDYMGQTVTKPDYNGTLENLAPSSEQKKDCTDGLNNMFNNGQRQTGTGYELGQGSGENNTGMTYSTTKGTNYYAKYKNKNNSEVTNYWYYPVDSRVGNESLVTTSRYKDLKDFGLNGSKNNNNDRSIYGTFWSGVPTEDKILEYLNEGNTDIRDTEKLSTAKSLVNVGDVENKYFIPAYNLFKNLKQMITTLESATKSQYSYIIDVQGFASSHGYVKSNVTLAENRAAVIAGWMKDLGVFDFGGKDSINHAGNGQINETDQVTESDFRPKAARAAVVKFRIVPSKDKDKIPEIQEYEDVKHETKYSNQTRNVESTYSEVYDTSESTKYENETYDNEYTYFKQINERDDMVKRYIADKVDYFDPAFHSITPEGFNARLTFLNQCTRQGPTISSSDLGMGSAYGAGNLAFGRAPICVLRIGDFYNTKICIDNININYDRNGVLWDSNPEGVGLQPMLADVTINFTFLGGSDLSGPIARLQHAASFNYYANTSVYDRRADYRDHFVTPEDDTAKSWNPVLLNKKENRNVSEHVDFRTRPVPKRNNDIG